MLGLRRHSFGARSLVERAISHAISHAELGRHGQDIVVRLVVQTEGIGRRLLRLIGGPRLAAVDETEWNERARCRRASWRLRGGTRL